MREIQRFRASVPTITREAEESARARLLHEIHTPPAPARRRLPRLAWRIAVAGALSVVIGIGVVRSQVPQVTPVAGVQELSERAAEAAEARGGPKPSPGQWLYIRERRAAPGDGLGVNLGERTTDEIWTSVDGEQIAWYQPGGELLVQGTHPGISAADLAEPPVTPQRLLDRIDKVTAEAMAGWFDNDGSPHEEPREQRLFQAIYQLMGEQALGPEVRAALFRALPLIEGVVVRPDAVDAEGRHGVAFSHTDDWARYELILSPDDFRYLGTYGVTVADRTMTYPDADPVFVPAGTPLVLSAQLETHLVDKAGQRP
ncbi:CU044_5270 family protein [Streptosporangium sp. NPDC023615]|uniref:CU044_5270 family protein n=1 Tax=Streptosporangium sp. NPDC023615 TaxID=3154794 RepID=UPI0034193E0D